MDLLLFYAVRKLEELGTRTSQGVRQFNSLLLDAKSQLRGKHDIQALEPFANINYVLRKIYRDATRQHRSGALSEGKKYR